MRYLVLAVIILVLGLLIVQLQSLDQALAYADDALLTMSKWTGNPQFLVDLRSKVHGYRYDRATPPVALKMRIVRKGDPPRVLPPPTPVVNPRVYQYGVMPNQLSSPLRGVLGPDEPFPPIPSPPANVVPVKYTDDFEEKVPRGEVQSLPTWERKFAGNVNFDVARDWTGYVVWGQPTLDGEFTCRHSGEWAQKISGQATFRSGIMRQFKAAPNTDYALKVYGHLHVLGGGAVHVGVDPTGGTNPSAETVVWFPQYTDLGRWMEMTASGKAFAPVITVFLEGYSLFDDNTNSYFDDFELLVYQEA
jgi:hypothetical protein